MPRSARRESGSGIYHVTVRGAGRRRIFEDDGDRRRFVEGLGTLVEKDRIALLAWCLMDNHVHVLAKAAVSNMTRGFHRLATSYACYFNGRHGHVGPVFQGRFDSAPVETDEHLLAAARYIHRNPLVLGIEQLDEYPWSSYAQYCGEPGVCDDSIVLDRAGGREAFVELCGRSGANEQMVSLPIKRMRLSEADAERVLASYLGSDPSDRLATLDKAERDRTLRTMKTLGLSVRQIERLTGVGRGIVTRA